MWHLRAENADFHYKLLPTENIDLLLNLGSDLIYELSLIHISSGADAHYIYFHLCFLFQFQFFSIVVPFVKIRNIFLNDSFYFFHLLFLTSVSPVSYTHLDV